MNTHEFVNGSFQGVSRIPTTSFFLTLINGFSC